MNDTRPQKMARDRAGLPIARWRIAQNLIRGWQNNNLDPNSSVCAVIEWIEQLKKEVKRQSVQIEKLKAEIKQLKGWLSPP